MNEEEIERLAALLKRQGLATSYIDARRMAESMIVVRNREVSAPKKEEKKEDKLLSFDELEEIREASPEPKKDELISVGQEPEKELGEDAGEASSHEGPDALRFDKPDYDITKEAKTLKELMQEDAEKIYKEERRALEEKSKDFEEEQALEKEEGKAVEKEEEKEVEKEEEKEVEKEEEKEVAEEEKEEEKETEEIAETHKEEADKEEANEGEAEAQETKQEQEWDEEEHEALEVDEEGE